MWKEKSMYGRKYMGVERTTALIGPDGRIERIWRKVKVPGHAEEVLAAARAGDCGGAICEGLTLIMSKWRKGCAKCAGPERMACSLAIPGIERSYRARISSLRWRAAKAHARLRCGHTQYWTLISLLPLALIWAGAATVYIAFHDDMLAAYLTREARMQYAYEDRIAEARAELDRVASRQLLDQTSFEGRMHELLTRQARIDEHDRIIEALATASRRSRSPERTA